MSYVNGIKNTGDKCKVQIKVNGKLICRTFSALTYGSIQEAKLEAERFVTTRKSLSESLPSTGVRNIHENVVRVNDTNYLYLRVKKGKLDKSICVGKLEKPREQLRQTKRYAKALSELSGLLVERKAT